MFFMDQWKIGCSGFYYTEWKSVFYPEKLPQRKWFEYYCEHFNALELNVTFYRFPKIELLRSWYDRSPESFNFCVKAPRLITHYKRFSDAQLLITDFYELVSEGLKEKGNAVLFQFPSTFAFDLEALNRIVSLLSKSFVNILEFRHASWWTSSVFETLEKNNVTFCGMSHPMLPDGVIKTSSTIYYRFHGVPQLYHSMYKPETLQKVGDKISALDAAQVCVYFNNTASGAALVNAREMQQFYQAHAISK
jgi:uncharacterized protein YecE (DUF72 family)